MTMQEINAPSTDYLHVTEEQGNYIMTYLKNLKILTLYISLKKHGFLMSITFSALAAISAIFIAPHNAFANMIVAHHDIYIEKPSPDNNHIVRKISADRQSVSNGDVIVYVVTYRNIGTQNAHNFAVTNKLPAGLAFLNSTRNVQVSFDKGRNWQGIASSSWLRKTKSSAIDNITHLRWIIPFLAKGETGQVSFRAKIS